MDIIDLRRKSDGKIRPNQDVLGVPAIDGVAGEGWPVAEVLHVVCTEPAIAINPTHPTHTHSAPEGKILGFTANHLTHYLVTRDELGHSSWQISFNDMQIGSTDSAGKHTKEQVSPYEVRLRDLCHRNKG
jgi:hypothetical protein